MNTITTSKFIRILKTLNEGELKAFESWLKSPWCNSNKNLIRLLACLKKFYPYFESRKLTKERLFQQVLPNGKFSTRRMNNLLSEGYLAIEQFLVFQGLSQNQSLQKDLLAKEFQYRHLEAWFFKKSNKEIVRLEQKEIKDWEDHLDLLRLHRQLYHHPSQNPRLQPGGKTIIEMGEQLDLIYLLEKATIINEKIFRSRILKDENHEISIEIEKWLSLSEGIDHPALSLYKMRFAYTEDTQLEQYFALRTAFFEQFDTLNSKQQKVHLQSLFNDTSKLIRAGLLDITDSLPLHKLGLKSEIILHEGLLSYNIYATVVSASNTKGDFSYTNYFIHEYTPKLEKEFQVDALNWAKGHTAYWQKNLNDCLDILLAHHFKTLYFLLLSRVLTTQVYFDLHLKNDAYQTYLFNYFDSFEKWLNREKFRAKFSKKSFLRFIQLSRVLAKYYANVNARPGMIAHLLKKESNVQALNWLHQKKEEILQLKK